MESPATISPFAETVITENDGAGSPSEEHDGASFQVSLLSFLQTTFDNEEIVLSSSSHLSDPNSSSDSEGYLDEEALFAPERPASQLVDDSTDSDASECQIVKIECAPTQVLRRSARLTQAASSIVHDEVPSSSGSSRTPTTSTVASSSSGPTTTSKSHQLLSRHPHKRLRTSSLFRPASIPEIVDLTGDSEEDSSSEDTEAKEIPLVDSIQSSAICKTEPSDSRRTVNDSAPQLVNGGGNSDDIPSPSGRSQPAQEAASQTVQQAEEPARLSDTLRNLPVIAPCSNCGFHRRRYAQRGRPVISRPHHHTHAGGQSNADEGYPTPPAFLDILRTTTMPSHRNSSQQTTTTTTSSGVQGTPVSSLAIHFPPISVAPYVNLPPQLPPYVHILAAGTPVHFPRTGNAYASTSHQNSLWESQLARAEIMRISTTSPPGSLASSNHAQYSNQHRHQHSQFRPMSAHARRSHDLRPVPGGESIRQDEPPSTSNQDQVQDSNNEQSSERMRLRGKKRSQGLDTRASHPGPRQTRQTNLMPRNQTVHHRHQHSPPSRPQNPVHNQSQNRPIYTEASGRRISTIPPLIQPRIPDQMGHPPDHAPPMNPCNCHLSQMIPYYQHYHSNTHGIPPPPASNSELPMHLQFYRNHDHHFPHGPVVFDSPLVYPPRRMMVPHGRLSGNIGGHQGSSRGSVNFLNIQGPVRTAVGVMPTVIENCTVKYTLKLQDTVREASKCPICLTEYAVEDSARRLPCMHLFHTECIDTWLKTDKRCPVCRVDITLRPEELLQSVQQSSLRIPSAGGSTVQPPPPITVQGTAVE